MTKPLSIPNLVLIGPMGGGKTTVGRLVAALLDWQFVDVDEQVAQQLNINIPELVEGPGEAYFRQLENRVLCKLAARRRQVIGTGGGIVLRPDNLEVMHECGWIVALLAPPGELARRVWWEREHRPLLRGIRTEEELAGRCATLLAARLPAYSQANVVIETGGLLAEDVANLIYQQPVVQHLFRDT